MPSSFTVGRAQLLFALCLPLAILLGYLLSDPQDPANNLVVLLLFGILLIPVMMRGYHFILLLSWNAAIAPILLPGQAFIWIPLAVVGAGFAVINRFTSVDARFLSVPAITKPMFFLLAVTLGTALVNGGFGIRSLGSESYGGRNYVYIFAAICGYFALSSQRIPLSKASLYSSLFFLTGVTSLIPNLAFLGGRSWYFLFNFFPPSFALEQAVGELDPDIHISRVFGLTVFSVALLCFVLVRYGLRRTLNLRKPLPFAIFVLALVSCAFCGFRSILVIFFFTLLGQMWLEGFLRLGNLATIVGTLVVAGALLIPNAQKLPLVVQRTMSVLPIELNPIVEQSAEGSSLWRIEMWKTLLPDVPKYFFKGKGFGIDPTELAFAQHNARFGYGFAGAVAAGDYHSGPLSLIIPLGIWGVIGFVWLIIAGTKYLYAHYKFGDPSLRKINTFLLAYFLARFIFFVFVFGGFFGDLFIFTGILGLSVSLNGTTIPTAQTAKAEDEAGSHSLAYAQDFAASEAS